MKFHIEYRHAYEMIAFLARHDIDLAFTNELYKGPQIESVPGFEERIICVGPRLGVHRLPCADFKRTIHFCRLKTVHMGRATPAFWNFLLERRPVGSAGL